MVKRSCRRPLREPFPFSRLTILRYLLLSPHRSIMRTELCAMATLVPQRDSRQSYDSSQRLGDQRAKRPSARASYPERSTWLLPTPLLPSPLMLSCRPTHCLVPATLGDCAPPWNTRPLLTERETGNTRSGPSSKQATTTGPSTMPPGMQHERRFKGRATSSRPEIRCTLR